MLEEKAGWKFDETVVPVFDMHVRQSVPLYDEMHRMIADIGGWFLADGTNVYDIGTATGEVITNLTAMYPTKNVQYLGVDTSKEMIEEAEKRFAGKSNVHLLKADATNDDLVFNNASYVVSMLTIQFIPQKQRAALLKKIYNGMETGGGFVLVEKIIGNNARFNDMWVELYHDMKARNGLTKDEIFAKSRAIRGILRPLTMEENLQMLKDAGFKDIDLFFKWCNFAGFVATK